jgi:hypothetical protein
LAFWGPPELRLNLHSVRADSADVSAVNFGARVANESLSRF